MRALKFIIPIMLVVGSFGWMMLSKNYQEVPPTSRVFITIGAMIVSGGISFFLFPKDEGEKY
ncbi:histidine kinase [Sporosarcina sp. 179-K 3D1 HS]|uniref:histidine kinase n=1 Tax=Sporosarcina sp. 179-K 3D1 HS TaxID=3232169 RepID=UPI0039A39212